MKRKKTGPDDVCGAAPDSIKLKIAHLPEDPSYILIEGDKDAFKFLSDLLAKHAEGPDCGFSIGPRGPGNRRFKRGSTLGLYLHRLPCVEKRCSRGRE